MPSESISSKERPCSIRLKKLSEANGDYKKSDVISPAKLTKDAKALLLPKKSNNGIKNKKNKEDKSKKKGKKNDKFQLKISGFFSPNSRKKLAEEAESEEELTKEVERERKESGNSESSRPDSGFASRSETPAVESEAGSKAGSPIKEDSAPVKEENSEESKDHVKDEVKTEEDAAESDEESEKDESEESEEESDWDGDSDDGFEKAANKRKPVHKNKKVQAAARNTQVVIPGALKSEMSAYEKVRADNISERQAMLAALMADFSEFKADSGIKNKAPPKKKRKLDSDGKFISTVKDTGERRTSARIKNQEEGGESLGSDRYTASDFRDPEKRFRLAEEDSDYDEEDYANFEARTKKKAPTNRWAVDPNENILMPEDITKSMLNKVAERFGQKVYNQNIGTSCHQCRQKTTDTKTICRSGTCVGVRGQFCGRCLEIRYGEDAREALMNPDWKCPPCRGFCNCSICRNRNGKGATGILIQMAQSKGFDNVAAYLASLQKKKGTD